MRISGNFTRFGGGLQIASPITTTGTILLNGLTGQSNWFPQNMPGGTISIGFDTSELGLIMFGPHWSNGYWGINADLTNYTQIRVAGVFVNPDNYGVAHIKITGTIPPDDVFMQGDFQTTPQYFDKIIDISSYTGNQTIELWNTNAEYVRYDRVELFP